MCSINGSLSKNHSLTCGVPQGTILVPLLFLLYINDLPNCLSNCEPRMYADDTHLTYAGDCVDKFLVLFKEARNSFYVEVGLVPSKRNPTRESAWLSMRERFEL